MARIRRRVAFLTAWLGAAGCQPQLSPQERDTIDAWLLCDECVDAERQESAALENGAVPRLAGALYGPSTQRLYTMRQKFNDAYDLAGGSDVVSRYEYVGLFLDNYRASYQKRAAVSLGDIGTPRAVRELQKALDRNAAREIAYRDDVLQEIRAALDAADPDAARSAIIRAAEDLFVAASRGIAERDGYVSQLGVLGREAYVFDPADHRFVTQLLVGPLDGADEDFGGAHWNVRYRGFQDAQRLFDASEAASGLEGDEPLALRALARTFQALDLLLITNTRDTLGAIAGLNPIATHRAGPLPDPPGDGSMDTRTELYATIIGLLDEATALMAATSRFPVDLSFPPGFTGFTAPGDFLTFIEALKARVQLYGGNASAALAAVDASFVDQRAPMDSGVYYDFGREPGHPANSLYDSTASVILAHPSLVTGLQAGDTRASKLAGITSVGNPQGYAITSEWAFTLYNSETAPIPIIKNEELWLIRAEALLELGDTADAIAALDIVRTAYGLAPLARPLDESEVRDEILYNRRYSLLFEGQRWIDVRRSGSLSTLPIDLPAFVVHDEFPFPRLECMVRTPRPISGC